jgi:hypothetical protein
MIISSIGLIYVLIAPLDLRASNNDGPEVPEMKNSLVTKFDDILNLSNNTEDSVYGQVRASDNNIYVVWQESMPGSTHRNYEIFFKKSIDKGNSFGEKIRLSDNIGFSEHPQMASENESVYVVWADNTNNNKQIYFRKSDNGGNSFGEQKILSEGNSTAFNQEISTFGDKVYVVWLEKVPDEPYRIKLASSYDGGETFHKPITLSENATQPTFPKISAFDSHVYVAWNVEDQLNSGGVYFISSFDSGMTFGNTSKLNIEEKDFGEPQVASFGNKVYVIWGGSDTHKQMNLTLARSDDYGSTFSDLKNISETEDGSLIDPTNVEIMTNQNNRIFIAWQDKLDASDKDEILFASSSDGGESFSGVTNLSNNTDISECPSIVVSDNMVFITWEDLTPGNHEILFSRGTIL